MNRLLNILLKSFLGNGSRLQAIALAMLGKINTEERPIIGMIVEMLRSLVENEELWGIIAELLLGLLVFAEKPKEPKRIAAK